MAKSILEELEELVGKDAAAKISAKSDIATRLTEGERLYKFYTGDDDPDAEAEAAKERERATQAEKDRQAMAAKAEADRVAAVTARNNSTTVDNKSILAELTTLLDTKLADLRKDFIPASKLPEYEGAILSRAIKTSHEVSRIESTHEKEFNEPLDLDKFDGWVNEQKKAGATWSSVTKAYDSWVQERRVEAKIKAGIAEGIKAKVSADGVPAQTVSAALSPAQQVLHEARKATTTGEKSNAVKAAEKLAALERTREHGAEA